MTYICFQRIQTSACNPGFSLLPHSSQRKHSGCQSYPKDVLRSAAKDYMMMRTEFIELFLGPTFCKNLAWKTYRKRRASRTCDISTLSLLRIPPDTVKQRKSAGQSKITRFLKSLLVSGTLSFSLRIKTILFQCWEFHLKTWFFRENAIHEKYKNSVNQNNFLSSFSARDVSR